MLAAGNFVTAMTTLCDAILTPAEGEAWGLLQGINWIVMMGYRKVIFELDCKTVVDHEYKENLDCSEYGLLLHECRILLKSHNDYDVAFAKRQANRSAHALAVLFIVVLLLLL